MTCLITGADLYLGEGMGFHGDLFEVGECYVFNAVMNTGGQYPVMLTVVPNGPRTLVVHRSVDNLFEKRGVVVVPKGLAALTDEAEAYITRGRNHG